MVKVGDPYPVPKPHIETLHKLNKNYSIGKIINSGNYGHVCNGTMDLSNKKVEIAVKIIDLNKTSEDYRTKFLPKELFALEKLKHEYIIKTHDIKIITNMVYIFMEKALGGDILDMLLGSKEFENGIPEPRVKTLYKMVSKALKYCHDNGVAHRDIKSENILLANKERTIAKLTDFGFSTICFVPNTTNKLLKNTQCGTPCFNAPEILKKQPYDAIATDVWSLGVVLFVLVNNEQPFGREDVIKLATEDINKPVKLEYKNKTVSKECQDLISKQLVKDPKTRYSMSQVLQHKWLQ